LRIAENFGERKSELGTTTIYCGLAKSEVRDNTAENWSMPATLETIATSIAAPAAVALAVDWLCRLLPARVAERIGLPGALAAGFFVGYLLLPEWAALLPKRHWQWLPWLVIAAAVVGWTSGRTAPQNGRTGGRFYVAWIAWCLLAAASGWLLTPTWATLWPPRMVTMPLLAAYLLALMFLLAALPERLVGRLFAGLLTAASLTTALLIAIAISLKTGQVAIVAAAALAGCFVAALIAANRAASKESHDIGTRSLIPLFAILVGGLAFVGTIEPVRGPIPIILLAPAAPLVLWLFAAGPLAKFDGWQAAMLQVIAVAMPLGLALAVVLAI
jgi:hypothetical protein